MSDSNLLKSTPFDEKTPYVNSEFGAAPPAPQYRIGNFYMEPGANGKIKHNIPKTALLRWICISYLFVFMVFLIPFNIPNCVIANCIPLKATTIDTTDTVCPNLMVRIDNSMAVPSHIHRCYITDLSDCPINSCPSVLYSVMSAIGHHSGYSLILISVIHFIHTVITDHSD